VTPLATLAIVTDATPATGAGHAMRCAVLAEAWRHAGGGTVILRGTVTIPFVQARFAAAGVAVAGGEAMADVVMCDHNDPGVRAGAGMLPGRLRVLVDDLGGAVPAGFEVVWNPNAYDASRDYPGFAGEVLSGEASVPLRRGIAEWRGGGSGTSGAFLGASAAGRQLLDALAGAAGKGSAWCAPPPTPPGWGVVDPMVPWDALSGCDRVVLSVGSATWEAGVAGVPVVLACIADNQRRIFEWGLGQGVPGVNVMGTGVEAGAAALLDALPRARALPRLRDGSGEVARRLLRLLPVG
jgi:hypothetical protein